MQATPRPLLVALDLNATRVQAVVDSGAGPRFYPLDEGRDELPMAISLEERRPEVGGTALAIRRKAPHLVCLDFLSRLGTNHSWKAGRHHLDPSQALALVFDALQPACAGAKGVVLTLPGYMSEAQTIKVLKLAEKARWNVLASIGAPMAAVLAAQMTQPPWSSLTFVLDVDEHALTWSAVSCDGGRGHLKAVQVQPRLGIAAWKGRLLDSVADRCVCQSRRDPRDSAAAEQDLYDQLDGALDLCASGQMADLVIQTPNWCQNLIWRPDEPALACAALSAQSLDDLRLLEERHGSPTHVVVTASAARLPGLIALLREALWQPLPEEKEPLDPDSDFGEGLMQDAPSGPITITVLEPDSVALAAFALAERIDQGELPRGPVQAVPLPAPQGADAGPARLHYEGHDYPLGSAAFTVGRHPACDLVFNSADYPTVSGRHCEIIFDRRMYVLHDHSRNGTLVNERPVIDEMPLQAGDRIRLGPGGPLLYFLGECAERPRINIV
jgi:hypothetical protein